MVTMPYKDSVKANFVQPDFAQSHKTSLYLMGNRAKVSKMPKYSQKMMQKTPIKVE